MSDKQIKWLILTIPTMIIGLWEYVRHEFLLPYISMELGNWLSPVIVFFVTMTFLVPLFKRYEQLQEQLKQEQEEKSLLQERERLARELHDGIAQSLFLCTVHLQRIKRKDHTHDEWETLDKHLRQIHDDVRHAISNLKSPPATTLHSTFQTRVIEHAKQFESDAGIEVTLSLQIDEKRLTPKEKIELYACLQEALSNIHKHAEATQVWIHFRHTDDGWIFQISDNGVGFKGNPFEKKERFGLKIMQERVSSIGSHLSLERKHGETQCMIWKGESKHANTLSSNYR